MDIVTGQKITSYYERYKAINITFTKEIIQVTGMITQQVYLKCGGDFWPCVVYSSSLEGAKIVANTKSGLFGKLQQANNTVSLRLCFRSIDTGSPLTFFVTARSLGYVPYGDSKDMAIFTLQFTQRPPDDFIEIIGRLLDANMNSTKRRDERISMTTETLRKLKVLPKNCAVFIERVPRRCILRDISFSGAKMVMVGIAKFLVNKDSAIRIDFDDPRESFLLRGKFARAEMVEGRQDLLALAIEFDESGVPMGYKLRLNDYLSQIHRSGGSQTESPSSQNTAPAEAPADTAGTSAVSVDAKTAASNNSEGPRYAG
jgi:hypothetical protein